MDNSESLQSICVICKSPGDVEQLSRLGVKGCDGLVEASRKKGEVLDVQPGQYVHKDCRRKYAHPNNDRGTPVVAEERQCQRTRGSGPNRFDFKLNCLFCGNVAKTDTKTKKRGHDVYSVRTLDFQNTVYTFCKKRNDDWGNDVLGRLEYGQDLPAMEARYHQQCSTNFRTGRGIPIQHHNEDTPKSKKGRPLNRNTDEAFTQIVDFLEEHLNDQMTVLDLVKKMQELCGENAYDCRYMKKKLADHFGCEIVISEQNGKQNVITFKSTADSILHSFHRLSRNSNTDSEKDALIKTAARLILEDIKTIDFSKVNYPSPEEIMSLEANRTYIPSSLELFLLQIINNKKCDAKIVAIAQTIVQASSPRRALLPLQLGLGVQMHHHFGSKFLIETLNSLGFCSSYSEIQKYEVAAATKWDLEIEKGQFGKAVQFVADNVDHNIATIDGHNTFHGMGIIATVTPGVKFCRSVPRISATNEDLLSLGKINIKFYIPKSNNFDSLIFQSLHKVPDLMDETHVLDVLVNVSRPLKLRSPSWSGFMQTVQSGSYPGKSSVIFLPMIDINPSDMTCIFSTLMFVAEQAKKLSVAPVVTFDQPLYWKAVQIILNEADNSGLKPIVVRLGSFHTQMSFLGCIGYLMQNTGLQELTETVYAPNTVTHMLSGKALSRAVRAHFLIDDALNTILIEKAFPYAFHSETSEYTEMKLDVNRSAQSENDLKTIEHLKTLFESVLSKDISIDSITGNVALQEASKRLTELKTMLSCYRTAKLWIQYMDMISILKTFVKAERLGNWQLHLKTLKEMLPYFAAAGHHLYLKSSYVYLQQMASLPQTHPEVHALFMSGYHVVRRNDRLWAGISTDLTIEQALMRSIKSTGGMTRGRGMSEVQRVQWLLSMPACSDVNNAMQEFTDQRYESSEQHKETHTTRIVRDTNDVDTFVAFLKHRNPFTDETSLRNIDTGVVAEENVNVDSATLIGEKVLKEMENKCVTSYTFKRSNRAVTLATKNSVKIGEESVIIDPQLLFQRLLTVSDISLDNPLEVFQYELCSHPASLFDSSGLMREPQKPSLANAIWECGSCDGEFKKDSVSYVLDGGSLIHRLPWKIGSTFKEICNSYSQMVLKYYGYASIVFDGYNSNPTTKDQTHERRSKGIVGTKVFFDETTTFKTKKDRFLSNTENKQNFVKMLADNLASQGCTTSHAEADADLLIVETAVSEAAKSRVVVIGEDTDLLVLLCSYAKANQNDIYFTSDTKVSIKVKKIWDIKKTIRVLGKDICELLLFIHAFTGCDTTSRIYSIGKGSFFKKMIADSTLRQFANVFLKDSLHETIQCAGEAIFTSIYGGTHQEGLNVLRYRKFVQKVQCKKSAVLVQSLPPTSCAAKYHCYRVYLQIQTWLGRDISPTDWGWISVNNKFVPIKTSLPAAPNRLLTMIRCCCKQHCDTKRCSCKKHGLHCSVACGECHGLCSNRDEKYDEASHD